MLLGQWGAPQAQKIAREMRAFAVSGGSIVSVRSGVWARDANDFIFIGKVDDDKLWALNMWRFNADKQLESIISAETVSYLKDNTWLMKDVQITNMMNEVEISKQQLPEYRWKTSLAPDKPTKVTNTKEVVAMIVLPIYKSRILNTV